MFNIIVHWFFATRSASYFCFFLSTAVLCTALPPARPFPLPPSLLSPFLASSIAYRNQLISTSALCHLAMKPSAALAIPRYTFASPCSCRRPEHRLYPEQPRGGSRRSLFWTLNTWRCRLPGIGPMSFLPSRSRVLSPGHHPENITRRLLVARVLPVVQPPQKRRRRLFADSRLNALFALLLVVIMPSFPRCDIIMVILFIAPSIRQFGSNLILHHFSTSLSVSLCFVVYFVNLFLVSTKKLNMYFPFTYNIYALFRVHRVSMPMA